MKENGERERSGSVLLCSTCLPAPTAAALLYECVCNSAAPALYCSALLAYLLLLLLLYCTSVSATPSASLTWYGRNYGIP